MPRVKVTPVFFGILFLVTIDLAMGLAAGLNLKMDKTVLTFWIGVSSTLGNVVPFTIGLFRLEDTRKGGLVLLILSFVGMIIGLSMVGTNRPY